MVRAAAFLAVLALACVGPVGPFPGGRLVGGRLAPPPGAWELDGTRVLELETQPDDPHSVNLHFVSDPTHLWVATVLGDSSTWAREALADPRVRVRVGDTLYELRADRVTDRAEISHVADLYVDKYVISPDVDEYEDAVVFRLVPR